MANPVCEVLLTDAALQAPGALPYGSGAVVDFFGAVRPLEDGAEISGIDYEAHATMASHQMEQIARTAIQRFKLDGAIIHHRVGFVPAGEASVFVRTTSRNRNEAYRANQWIMDELKKRVPIWKRPKFVNAEQVSKREAASVSS
jgi:molybdopterin synthase catalytic subunit